MLNTEMHRLVVAKDIVTENVLTVTPSGGLPYRPSKLQQLIFVELPVCIARKIQEK